MKYAYLRVSDKAQNLQRQIDWLKEVAPDIPDENIYADKQSGKDFERKRYQELKAVLVRGDEVIIKELDRFGRNKDEIKAEIQWFKESGIIPRIYDVPTTLIDFKGQDWIADMLNNVLIEVLGAIAEQERQKIVRRRREGVAAMPVVNGKKVSAKTGRGFGRPKREIADFKNFLQQKKDGIITVQKGCEILGISRSLWYQLEKGSGLSSLPCKS